MDLKNKNLYEVKEIQGNLITVSPIEEKKDENQRKVPKIEVLNPKKLKIRDGSIVRIALAKEIDFMEKIAALFFSSGGGVRRLHRLSRNFTNIEVRPRRKIQIFLHTDSVRFGDNNRLRSYTEGKNNHKTCDYKTYGILSRLFSIFSINKKCIQNAQIFSS